MKQRGSLLRIAWTAAAVVGLSLASLAYAQQDKVQLKNGKEKVVRVTSEDFDALRYALLEGGSGSFPWDDVEAIRYANARKFDEAIEAFATKKPAEALPLLEELAADDKLRAPLRHGALFHLGVAHQRSGAPDKALATYEVLLKEFPKSRYLRAVGANLLALELGDSASANAVRVLESALTAARSGSTDVKLLAGFDVLRGQLLERQKKPADAERVYESAAAVSGADPQVVAAAKLGSARCAQSAGRTADAERRYRDIVKADAPNVVLAGAWNGLGDIALAQATSKRDPDGLRVALLAYLRGVVLYVPTREDPSEEYERALAGATRAFRAIGELESNADQKRLFLDRARQRRDQLASEYPGSRFLQGL
jgi:tetratricopeptide (TPR) repeat protein